MVLKENNAFQDINNFRTLTKRFYSFSLLAARFAAGLTADVVKSEEDVMFLMHVDRKLNLNLPKEKQCTKFSKHSYAVLCLKERQFLCLCVRCVCVCGRYQYKFSYR